MRGKVKFLSVLVFSTILMLSICGCKAKEESDTLSDISVSPSGQSEQQSEDVQQTPDNQPSPAAPSPSPSESSAGGSGNLGGGTASQADPNEIPNTVIILIEEDRVFINGAKFKDAKALKTYIESVNSDRRIFRLFEDHAIQATHDWVMDVFRELQVEVLVTPNS